MVAELLRKEALVGVRWVLEEGTWEAWASMRLLGQVLECHGSLGRKQGPPINRSRVIFLSRLVRDGPSRGAYGKEGHLPCPA